MAKNFKILTILGSPQDRKSNTRALVEDFVADMAGAGLAIDHRVISLGRKKVLPCKGCWCCTKGKPCPVSKKDDLEEIKAAMVDCDMLIAASPVYTNDVTAQMKALFDRLFTWCHIFPLLGKYSLSACTTGNDGHKETAFFLEKMLATYGTYSFGTISSIGAFASGHFPFRDRARAKNRKLARRVAATVAAGKKPRVNAMQRKMFKTMKRKMRGAHTFRWLRSGPVNGQPAPPWLRRKMMERIIKKALLSEADVDRLAGYMGFEMGWWYSRGWLNARTFEDLSRQPVPVGFDLRRRLLHSGELSHELA